jgi:uncharacterized protein (TIGR03437 family)
MHRLAALLLILPCAFGANQPNFTFTTPAGTTVSAMAIDSAGNTYLTGSTTSSTFPATPGALQTQFTSGTCVSLDAFHGGLITFPCSNAFVVKLDPSGKTVFATYFGGNGTQTVATSISVDAAGNIFIAGTTSGNTFGQPNMFPTTPGAAFPSAADGGTFIAKLNPAGAQLVYSTILPLVTTHPVAMTIDSAGAAYIAGSNSGVVFQATPGAFQTAPNNFNSVGAVMKLNPSGSALVYATFLSGSVTDTIQSIAVDSAGDAYITGFTSSQDFPVTPGAFLTTFPQGSVEGFVTKLNPQASALVYSTFVAAGTGGGEWSIKLDAQASAWVLGPSLATEPQLLASGGTIFAHLSADGSALLTSAVLPPSTGLDVDAVGNIYVAGNYQGNLGTGFAAFQGTYGGNGDAYIARFSAGAMLSGSALTGLTFLGGSQGDTASLIAVAPDGSVVVSGTTFSSDFPAIGLPIPGTGAGYVTSIFADLTIQNAASFIAGAVSPGEIVAIRGYGLGPATGITPPPRSPGSGCHPFDIVCFGGSYSGFGAPILYQQYQQINAQVPWEIAGTTLPQVIVGAQIPQYFVPVTVGTRLPLPPYYIVPVVTALPGVFYVNNSDGTQNSPANPARPGDFVAIYGTGGGLTNPVAVTGGRWPLTDTLSRLTQNVSVTIGGENASVLYSGEAPLNLTGVFQINVLLPLDLPASSGLPLAVIVGGIASSPQGIRIAVR